VVAVQGDDGTGLAIDLQVFAGVGPVPGSFDDALGLGVSEQDGDVVFHVRVHVGLDVQSTGRHRERPRALHQPRHEVGAVAAEVWQGPAAVLHGVGEPVQKFRVHPDFFWPLVAVVGHHFADVAEGVVFVHQLVGPPVGAVPRGFVIGEQVDAVLASQGGHLLGMVEAHGQGFLHHHVDALRRAGLHHGQVLIDAAERRDRLGLSFG